MLHVVHCSSSISTVLQSLSNLPVRHPCLILSFSLFLSFFLWVCACQGLVSFLCGPSLLFRWYAGVRRNRMYTSLVAPRTQTHDSESFKKPRRPTQVPARCPRPQSSNSHIPVPNPNEQSNSQLCPCSLQSIAPQVPWPRAGCVGASSWFMPASLPQSGFLLSPVRKAACG